MRFASVDWNRRAERGEVAPFLCMPNAATQINKVRGFPAGLGSRFLVGLIVGDD